MSKIVRAIMSCHDKTGIVELAETLRAYKVEIVSTAGTLDTLRQAGIEAKSIADFTGVPEMLDGRVKSLHSGVHAGLLGVRDNKLHCEQMAEYDFQWVDMLVANLHPVESVLQGSGLTTDEIIDQIDIGGSAMIRSGAKNFRYVTVVVNPERYSHVIHELHAHEGSVSFETRYRLAQEAFALTSHYDAMIAGVLERGAPKES